jgi:hypothetical protein
LPQINVPGSNHPKQPDALTYQFNEFDDARCLATVREAFRIIERSVKHHDECNAAFRQMPGGRSLAAVWSDPTVWVCFDPSTAADKDGATLGKEVTISKGACNQGAEHVAATLVHEMAHVNGATSEFSAEDVLNHCGLGHHYNARKIRETSPSRASAVIQLNQLMYWASKIAGAARK